MSVFRTSASTTRPQTAAGITPETITGFQMTETAGAVARAKLYSGALAAPGACTGVENVAVGLVTVGDHLFKVTYVTAEGETELGTASAAVTAAGLRQIDLSGIPTLKGPGAHLVTGRNVYMTEAGGATYYRVTNGTTTIADNTTTTYSINLSDATLAGYTAAPANNTSGTLLADIRLAAAESKLERFPQPMAGSLARCEITAGAVQTLVYGR